MTSPYPKRKKQLLYTYQTRNFGAKIILEKTTGLKKLKITSPAFYNTEINKFKPDEDVTLSVTNKKPKRTENQNRYWWLYMTMIAKETGHTPEEIHEWAKGKFLTSKIVQIFGTPTRIRGSTTELSVSDFVELIMKVEAESGIKSPPVEDFNLAPLKTSVV